MKGGGGDMSNGKGGKKEWSDGMGENNPGASYGGIKISLIYLNVDLPFHK